MCTVVTIQMGVRTFLPTRRFAERRYADNVGRFADTYNCIKTAFHNTDILADVTQTMQNDSAGTLLFRYQRSRHHWRLPPNVRATEVHRQQHCFHLTTVTHYEDTKGNAK